MDCPRTAYCVVKIDVSEHPPRVTGVGIYSEPAMSLTVAHRPNCCYVDLAEARGADYEQARANLLDAMMSYAGWRWAVKWILNDRADATTDSEG